MLQISHISKQFGTKLLFQDASIEIKPGERIGLVGPNGTGKTTLMRMMSGEMDFDEGDVIIPKTMRLGMLRQDVTADATKRLLEETMRGYPEIAILEKRMIEMEEAISDDPHNAKLLEKYGALQNEFEHLEGYQIESRAKSILFGLGFKADDLKKSMRHFSGGWMMRIALARLLLQQPDVLLLDEPTNHLDLESVIWLENFILNYEGIIILISHDQYFLNRVVTRIIEIANYKLIGYPGNYTHYELEKAKRLEMLEAQLKSQQKEIEKTEKFIERFRYKASKAKQVQSRVKMLEKIERLELPEEFKREMKLILPQPERAGKIIAELSGVKKSYGNTQVYESLDLIVTRGQKIGLVGPNGAGKSTLLKILAQSIDIQGGSLNFGHHVQPYYYAQHQLDILNAENTILQELAQATPEASEQQVRTLAGMFLFSADEVFKPISVLSGGEKARVALAKMLANPANFLILDEPTNHLDIHSRRILQEALSNYEGTIIFISHDREFINGISQIILEVVNGRIKEYQGDYEYYLWKKEQEAEELEKKSAIDTKAGAPSNKKIDRQRRAQFVQEKQKRLGPLQKSIQKMEDEISKLEDEKNELTELVCKQEVISDSTLFSVKMKRLNEVSSILEKTYHNWETATEELETKTNELEAEFEI